MGYFVWYHLVDLHFEDFHAHFEVFHVHLENNHFEDFLVLFEDLHVHFEHGLKGIFHLKKNLDKLQGSS